MQSFLKLNLTVVKDLIKYRFIMRLARERWGRYLVQRMENTSWKSGAISFDDCVRKNSELELFRTVNDNSEMFLKGWWNVKHQSSRILLVYWVRFLWLTENRLKWLMFFSSMYYLYAWLKELVWLIHFNGILQFHRERHEHFYTQHSKAIAALVCLWMSLS